MIINYLSRQASIAFGASRSAALVAEAGSAIGIDVADLPLMLVLRLEEVVRLARGGHFEERVGSRSLNSIDLLNRIVSCINCRINLTVIPRVMTHLIKLTYNNIRMI